MRKIGYFAALTIFVAMPAAAKGPPAQQPPSQPPQAVEELLGDVGDGVLSDGGWDVSLDGRRLAWRTKREKKWVMIVDGQPGPIFDEVSSPVFSPDGKRLAYAVESNNKWMMVVDGKTGPEFDHLSERQPVGRSRAGSWGQAKTPLVWFSPNSKHVAYLARRGKKWFIVIDGRESTPYEDVGGPFFSADGEHMAYTVKDAGKWSMVVDGKDEGLTYDEILVPGPFGTILAGTGAPPRFSRDGQRFGYMARRNRDWFAVLNGKEMPIWKDARLVWTLPPKCVSFSKDLRRFAFIQTDPEKKGFAIVVDGQPGASFDWIGCPVFSPDEKQFAYIANRGKANAMGKDQDQFVVSEGQAGRSFKRILALYFSPDSRRISYLAWQDMEKEGKGKVIEVINGAMREVTEQNKMQMLMYPPTFSPDSQHVAYVLVKDFWAQGYWGQVWDTRPWRMSYEGRINLYLDGKPFGREYDAEGISNPLFSPDSRHLAYVISGDKAASGRRVVVNGQEGKAYSDVFPETLVFSSPNSVFYVALQEKGFYRVTQTIREP